MAQNINKLYVTTMENVAHLTIIKMHIPGPLENIHLKINFHIEMLTFGA